MNISNDNKAQQDLMELQAIIINALEDVKAVDIQIFDTTKLTPLFERVIVASGQSSRQTKALATNVFDSVLQAGHVKPRIEGEDNAEWIVVDCGSIVVHLMQPSIRTYYRLEELWDEYPINLNQEGKAK